MKHKQINMRSKRIKIILITALLCVVGFSSCADTDKPKDSPLKMDATWQNMIIGKWHYVGKCVSKESNEYIGYTDIVESDKFMEFKKNSNLNYGYFISNMLFDTAYYVVSRQNFAFDSIAGVRIYHFLTSIGSASIYNHNENYYFNYVYRDYSNDTLVVCKPSLSETLTNSFNELFQDSSEYEYYFFEKIQD